MGEDRLRFDFTHFSPVSKEEILKIEKIVNDEIMMAHEISTKEMTLEEAKESGAMALFNEKYSQKVRVVSAGDFSSELCGGTHVRNSGEIGLLKIISESGVAAGVRRIEALTGSNAINYIEEKQNILNQAADIVKSSEKDILTRLHSLMSELKEKDKEINELKLKMVSNMEEDILNSAKEINGIKLITSKLEGIDANSLRELAEKLRSKSGVALVLLAGISEGKVNFVAMASKEAVAKGIHCGKIIKEVAQVAGGGGGGRPDMAQAGGKLPEKAEEALNKAETIIKSIIN